MSPKLIHFSCTSKKDHFALVNTHTDVWPSYMIVYSKHHTDKINKHIPKGKKTKIPLDIPVGVTSHPSGNLFVRSV